MFHRSFFISAFLAAFTGLAGLITSAYAQAPAKTEPASLLVVVDGLACPASGPSGMPALSFRVGMTTNSAGGATKAVFGDLTLTRAFDSCSARLLKLGMTGEHIRKITITDRDKSGQPLITILLEDVTVSAMELQDPEAANPGEDIALHWAKMTFADAASNTNLVINRL